MFLKYLSNNLNNQSTVSFQMQRRKIRKGKADMLQIIKVGEGSGKIEELSKLEASVLIYL